MHHRYQYRCYFRFGVKTVSTTAIEGVSAFTQGFWINKHYEFTKASDNIFWIPPSAILYIEKEEVKHVKTT